MFNMNINIFYKHEQIITYPKYPKNIDPQNREIYDLVEHLVHNLGSNNHYTCDKISSKFA
jgi:stress-induced morphogen